MEQLILYGAGKRCEKLLKILPQSSMNDVAIVDSDVNKQETKIGNKNILSPNIIMDNHEARVCITVGNVETVKDIRKKLQTEFHYDINREIGYSKVYFSILAQDIKIKQNMQNNLHPNEDKEISVLFSLNEGFILGGVEEWTKDICLALKNRGMKNIYVLAQKGDYDVPDLLINNMIYIEEQNIDEEIPISSTIKAIMEKLPCKIVTTKPDNIMLAAYLIKYFYPNMIDVISTVRGSSLELLQIFVDLRDIPDCIIGVSKDIKNYFIQNGIDKRKVYSMCVPFECDEVLNRSYTDCKNEPIHIGYAGRLSYYDKRMDLLIKLIDLLVEKELSFIMEIAGDGEAYNEINDFINGNDLYGKVILLGKIERANIPQFWKRQDICVNISDTEGRCHSVIEAMGNGAVPVVTATSGVREDICEGINGYIVPIGDYQSMADKIEYLSQNRHLLCKMGNRAHDEIYPKSTVESHLAFWDFIFKIQF